MTRPQKTEDGNVKRIKLVNDDVIQCLFFFPELYKDVRVVTIFEKILEGSSSSPVLFSYLSGHFWSFVFGVLR